MNSGVEQYLKQKIKKNLLRDLTVDLSQWKKELLNKLKDRSFEFTQSEEQKKKKRMKKNVKNCLQYSH